MYIYIYIYPLFSAHVPTAGKTTACHHVKYRQCNYWWSVCYLSFHGKLINFELTIFSSFILSSLVSCSKEYKIQGRLLRSSEMSINVSIFVIFQIYFLSKILKQILRILFLNIYLNIYLKYIYIYIL